MQDYFSLANKVATGEFKTHIVIQEMTRALLQEMSKLRHMLDMATKVRYEYLEEIRKLERELGRRG